MNIMIISILLSLSFILILLINNQKNKLIKHSFIFLSLIFLILILIYDNNYIYELLKSIITYIWYPNYLIFTTVILISIIIFIYNLLKNNKIIYKITSYILFGISFSCYMTFLGFSIDPLISSSLYSTKSLIIMRIETITFLIWIIVNCFFKIRGRYEK